MTVGMTPAAGAQPLAPGATGMQALAAPATSAFASPLSLGTAPGGFAGQLPQTFPGQQPQQFFGAPAKVGPGQLGQAPMKVGPGQVGPGQFGSAPMKFPGGGSPIQSAGMCPCGAAAPIQAGGGPALIEAPAPQFAAMPSAAPQLAHAPEPAALAGGPSKPSKLPIEILEDADADEPPANMTKAAQKLTGRDALLDVVGSLLGGGEDAMKVKNRKDGGPTDYAELAADRADVAKDDFNAGTVRNDLAALMDGDGLADA